MRVNGIDQPLQSFRSAIRILRRIFVDSVVSPIARSGKLSNRHDLDAGNAKFHQMREVRDQAVERAFSRVCPDMKFIQNTSLQLPAFPVVIGPAERTGIHQLRRAVNSLWLESRGGIGEFAPIFQSIQVARSALRRRRPRA